MKVNINMKPMLCESVALSEVDRLINDDKWWAQQKLDGDRLLVHVTDGNVVFLNREGTSYSRKGVPARVIREFATLDGEWYFDGELMDDGTFWLFDMPLANYQVHTGTDWDTRSTVLDAFFVLWNPGPSVRLLPTVHTSTAKRDLFERLRAANREGIIFKRIDGLYRPGKRTQSMLKAKFTKTADCVVTAVRPEGRDNCLLGLFRDGSMVPVGSVSLVGRPAVSVGDVVEVRYLYAGDEHRLVQPVMLRRRDDKAASECTLDQLQYTDRSVAEVQRRFTYRAVGRRGVDVAGVFVDEEPGEFARVRFGRRWQSLVILDAAGVHAGGIQSDPETGKRIWWGGTAFDDAGNYDKVTP